MIREGEDWGGLEVHLSAGSKRRIQEAIRQRYAGVSITPEGRFRYPTGRAGLERLGYPPGIIQRLPSGAITSYCGVGNPFELGLLAEGEAVLGIGCGGGADTLVAAMKVGPEGRAVGIDLTLEMVALARKNLRASFFGNAFFQVASAEALPFSNESFHVIISNGVFNLVPEKLVALKEALRVLKPAGRMFLADQILEAQPPPDPEARLASWFR